jgi:glycolate oxidase
MSLDEMISEIKDIVGIENCSTRPADLYVYGFDASIHHRTPVVVVRPKDTGQVSKIVKLANLYRIPVVPRGAGSALCGHSVPIHGGMVLDMCKMDLIKLVKVEDLYCIVEPGVIYDELNKNLEPLGFFFPPTPGSGAWCTIGGMVATNASGMKAIKYGATRDYVMGLEIVLPTGEIIHCGTKTLKNSSGYQLEKLFVGSEGTLGVITEITLRLSPLPQKKAQILASFDKLELAGRCVSNIIAKPCIPAAIEIMDKVCLNAVNKSMSMDFPECEGLLLIEVDGHPAVVREDVDTIKNICRATGATTVETTEDVDVIAKWTAGRKAVLPALSRLGEKSVSVSLADDMAVPISQVANAIVAFQEISVRNNVVIGTYGHAGDGNLHTKMLIDPLDKSQWLSAEKTVTEIFEVVLELGGTVTGEHGVAISKAPYMQKERKDSLNVMRTLKKALDPNNIMNPGKLFDWNKSIVSHLRYPV